MKCGDPSISTPLAYAPRRTERSDTSESFGTSQATNRVHATVNIGQARSGKLRLNAVKLPKIKVTIELYFEMLVIRVRFGTVELL